MASQRIANAQLMASYGWLVTGWWIAASCNTFQHFGYMHVDTYHMYVYIYVYTYRYENTPTGTHDFWTSTNCQALGLPGVRLLDRRHVGISWPEKWDPWHSLTFFSFVFSGICIKFWFQIWHIILAQLFRGWILHGFVIDFWTDFDLIFDVFLIRFPFKHLPC